MAPTKPSAAASAPSFTPTKKAKPSPSSPPASSTTTNPASSSNPSTTTSPGIKNSSHTTISHHSMLNVRCWMFLSGQNLALLAVRQDRRPIFPLLAQPTTFPLVPKQQPKIARRFNAGCSPPNSQVPQGRPKQSAAGILPADHLSRSYFHCTFPSP